MAMTAKEHPYRTGFGPFPEDVVVRATNGNRLRSGLDTDEALAEVERVITEHGPEMFAAMVVEPIQGEGGFNVPQPGFLAGLAELARRHGIVFVVDEIQAGLGRTGRMFASEHDGVAGDLTLTAKALGAGLPISAVTGRADIMNSVHVGGLGGTYAGNPIACEAALAVFEVLDDPATLANVARIESAVRDRLDPLVAEIAVVADVRGRGAMLAIEFADTDLDSAPRPHRRDLSSLSSGWRAHPHDRNARQRDPVASAAHRRARARRARRRHPRRCDQGADGMSGPADLLDLDDQFTDAERATRDEIRAFVDSIRPMIPEWYEKAHFPVEIMPELGRLGALGMIYDGYGCPGRGAVEYGLAAMELEAGDSGLRTAVSVQGSLAMSAIHKFGSAAQKSELLPQMAAGELIGCFGLTEPNAGSDPSSMTTFARRDGDDWVLNGSKRWIGLATLAGIADHLGADRRRRARLRRADRLAGLPRHADRAEDVDARVGTVRDPARRDQVACICHAPRSPRRCAHRSPASMKRATASRGACSVRRATATSRRWNTPRGGCSSIDRSHRSN